MTERFRACVSVTLEHEGGYVNSPLDPGGETNLGISRRFLDRAGIVVASIEKLTRAKAVKIYQEHFWHDWLDKLKDPVLALQVFDFGVNTGSGPIGKHHAEKTLQRAAGVRQDGDVGPKTLAAANGMDQELLRRKFAERALLYYTYLAVAKPHMKLFLLSWIRRTLVNLTYGIVVGTEEQTDGPELDHTSSN